MIIAYIWCACILGSIVMIRGMGARLTLRGVMVLCLCAPVQIVVVAIAWGTYGFFYVQAQSALVNKDGGV